MKPNTPEIAENFFSFSEVLEILSGKKCLASDHELGAHSDKHYIFQVILDRMEAKDEITKKKSQRILFYLCFSN